MSVRKSLAWSYGAQAFIFVLTFAVSVIVARILGPYEMGIFAIGAATAGAIAVLSAFGVGPYLVRHEAPDAQVRATAFTVNAALNVVVASVVLGVVLIGPMWGLIREVRQVLTLLALVPLLAIFEFLPGTFMHREMNFRVISLISMCRAVVNSALMLSMAWSGLGYLSPAVAVVGSSVFTVVAFNAVARSHASLRTGLTGWRDMTKFGLQMLSIGGLANLTARMSELILGHVLGLATLGIYTRASGLVNQVWENIYGLSTRVVFAQMAKEMRETGTLRNTYLHGLSLITAVLGPLFFGFAVLSGPVIHLLYGDRWSAAAAPLAVLLLAYFVALGFSMNWELCVLRHRTGWQARNEGLRAVVGLIAFSIGSTISVGAAAAGRFVDVVCGFALFGPRMAEMAGTQRNEIATIFGRGILLTLAAAGPSIALMLATGWSERTPWSLITPAIGAGVLLWFALLRWYRHPLLDELKRTVRTLARRLARRAAA